MLFFLGILSLLQILFFPGFIIVRIFKIKGFIPTLLLAFACSLSANYLFVFITAGLGIFNRIAVFLYILISITGALFILWKSNSIHLIRNQYIGKKRLKKYLKTLWPAVLLMMFFTTFIPVVSKIIAANPGVLDSCDAAASWNRWASEWYQTGSPQFTAMYPQLIPTNWALIYQTVGTTDIQMFTKALMSFFPLYLMIMIYHLHMYGGKGPKYAYRCLTAGLLSVTFYCYLLVSLHGRFIASGYADLPVSFFCFSAFYLWILMEDGRLSAKAGIILSALLVGSAAVTKQAGLFFVLVFLIFLFYIFINKRAIPENFFRWRYITISGFILIFMVAPWYGSKLIDFHQKKDILRITYNTSIVHAEKNLIKRGGSATQNYFATLKHNAKNQWPLLSPLIGMCLIVGFLTGVISSLRILLTAGFIIVPYFLIWALFFSYDFRNAVLLTPFIAYISGVSVTRIDFLPRQRRPDHSESMPKTFNVPSAGKIAGLGIIIFFLITFFLSRFVIGDDLFLQYNRNLVLEGGSAELNHKLYQYFHKNEKPGKIYSTYTYLKWLPELKDRTVDFESIIGKEERVLKAIHDGRDICEILSIFSRNNEIRYLLVPKTVFPGLFQQGISKKKLQELFRTEQYIFYETSCQ